jgi:hypothetical protein
MKILVAFFVVLFCLPASAQEKDKQEKKKPGFYVVEKEKEKEKAKEKEKPAPPKPPLIFTIDGKVKEDDKTRDLVVNEVFEFEKPNLQSKWNPDPISPADVGWSYLVLRVWDNGELCVQPRSISSKGEVSFGRAFTVRYYPSVKDVKVRTLIAMEGKWRLAGTTKNDKTGSVFFVFEPVSEKKK